MEKGREIRVKADEEFAIEKVRNSDQKFSRQARIVLVLDCSRYCYQAKLVKQEQQAIDAQYEKKRKGSETAQKMYVSLQIAAKLRSSDLVHAPARNQP